MVKGILEKDVSVQALISFKRKVFIESAHIVKSRTVHTQKISLGSTGQKR